jgi:hypothetical protein
MEYFTQMTVAIIVSAFALTFIYGGIKRSQMTEAERRKEDDEFDDAW